MYYFSKLELCSQFICNKLIDIVAYCSKSRRKPEFNCKFKCHWFSNNLWSKRPTKMCLLDRQSEVQHFTGTFHLALLFSVTLSLPPPSLDERGRDDVELYINHYNLTCIGRFGWSRLKAIVTTHMVLRCHFGSPSGEKQSYANHLL